MAMPRFSLGVLLVLAGLGQCSFCSLPTKPLTGFGRANTAQSSRGVALQIHQQTLRASTHSAQGQAKPRFSRPSPALVLGLAAGFLLAVGPSLAAKPFKLQLAKLGLGCYSSADLFPIQNLSMLSWILLLLFPRWKRTKHLALVAPAITAALYAAVVGHLLLPLLKAGKASSLGADFSSLAGIMQGFATKDGAFAGWLHYCVFDPLIGLGMVLDSQRLSISHFFVVPCLLLTMFFGPVGFLVYLIIRNISTATRRETLRSIMLRRNDPMYL
mmetsp:Transcript_38930/g.70241  ORF Transcript_38930/g.70241 Transcript_38930/m.70241 type:complete len:271 (-) Transcript_38930:221-1033(-)